MAGLSFLMGGDVAPIRESGHGIFGEVASLFQQADVSFFNLELPLSERGTRARAKAICHRGMPVNIDGLVEIGVSCVNVANNHILDFGDIALFDTLALLDEKRIGRFGAGRNLEEAREGYTVEKNGLRIGFLGYSTTLPVGFAATDDAPGVNAVQVHTAYQPKANLYEYPGSGPHIVTWTDPAHMKRMCDDIAAFRREVNVLIVYVHWGTSMSPYVNDFQREIAKAAIDAGAHGVFGGHQHVISAIEFYKGSPIVHGAGNLLFDTWAPFFNDETRKSFVFGATLTVEGLRDCYLKPVNTGVNIPPRLLSSTDERWKIIHGDLERLSGPFGTVLVARGDIIEVQQ